MVCATHTIYVVSLSFRSKTKHFTFFSCFFLLSVMEDRRSLFRSSSILSHVEGDGPTAFIHKRITESTQLSGSGPDKCTSYFIEPVQWMEPALLGVMEGQVNVLYFLFIIIFC